MKKILFILLMCVATLTACEHNNNNTKNTIKFLGIPVDGTKQEMIEQLQTKGFEYDTTKDCLVGEFNGIKSNIQLATINNKVWRVIIINNNYLNKFLADTVFDRFIEDFSNNEKYIRLNDDEISEQYTLSFWRKCCQDILYFNKCAVFAFKNSIKEDNFSEGVAIYTFYNTFDGGYGIMILYSNHNNAANGEDL